MKYENPPHMHHHRGRPVTKFVEEAKDLRKYPGAWGIVAVKPTQQRAAQLAHQINIGKYTSFRGPGTWTAVSRTVDGEFRVYVSYTGPVEGPQ